MLSSHQSFLYAVVLSLLTKKDNFFKFVSFLFYRKTTWQDALKEECEKRTPNWKPFDQGKRYETFSPEERVSFFYLLKFVFALTSAVGVLFSISLNT